MVATPIGNPADITLRACTCCKWSTRSPARTRATRRACCGPMASTARGAQLLALHQHNESEAAQTVIARLAAGERIAYVSDAGTPGVSDPGARLVAAARDGRPSRAAPAGRQQRDHPGRRRRAGRRRRRGQRLRVRRLPAEQGGRARCRGAGCWPTSPAASCCSRRRIASRRWPARWPPSASARSPSGASSPSSSRRSPPSPPPTLPGWFAASRDRTRGEFALVLHPGAAAVDDGIEGERVLRLLLAELPREDRSARRGRDQRRAAQRALRGRAAHAQGRGRVDRPQRVRRPAGISRRVRGRRLKIPSSLKAIRRGLRR